MPKKDCVEIIKSKEENPIDNKARNYNKKMYKYKKHYTNQELKQKDSDSNSKKKKKSFEE